MNDTIQKTIEKNYVTTCHFVNRKSLVEYYKPYGINAKDLVGKLARGEVKIGKPVGGVEVNAEGRWMVEIKK